MKDKKSWLMDCAVSEKTETSVELQQVLGWKNQPENWEELWEGSWAVFWGSALRHRMPFLDAVSTVHLHICPGWLPTHCVSVRIIYKGLLTVMPELATEFSLLPHQQDGINTNVWFFHPFSEKKPQAANPD